MIKDLLHPDLYKRSFKISPEQNIHKYFRNALRVYGAIKVSEIDHLHYSVDIQYVYFFKVPIAGWLVNLL